MNIRQKMLRSFRQIKNRLKINNLCGSRCNIGILPRQTLQIFQFHALLLAHIFLTLSLSHL